MSQKFTSIMKSLEKYACSKMNNKARVSCGVGKYGEIIDKDLWTDCIYYMSRLTSIAWFLQVGLNPSPLDPTLPCVYSVLTLEFGELQNHWLLLDTFFFRYCLWCFRQPLWHTTLGLWRQNMRTQSNWLLSLSFQGIWHLTVTFVSLLFLEACCRLKAEGGEFGDFWEISSCREILSSVSGDASSLWIFSIIYF